MTEFGELPVHIAVIMDGNGRWAENRGFSRILGHKMGVESVREIVRVTRELNIPYLTLYTFSKENWRRPKEEVNALFYLLKEVTQNEIDNLIKNNIKLRLIGNLAELNNGLQRILEKAINRTKENTAMTLTLALNYGGRQEILDAVKSIIREINGKSDANIDESTFRKYLYDSKLPDPDLIIRTSGEKRLSNFLLWQCAYSEFYFSPVPWPDFRKKEYLDVLKDYGKRKRRFGGL